MIGKRSRLEMYLDVLDKVNEGIKKPTNIMYKCNLSWIPMKEILDSLIEKDLVKEVVKKNRRTYDITERGRNLLRYLGSVLSTLQTKGPNRSFLSLDDDQPPVPLKVGLNKNLLSMSRGKKSEYKNHR
jgi:predicted transcriptional regulator